MRRSLCIAEPKFAPAGHVGTWKFLYTPAINLPKGSYLKFDILSNGRDLDWQIPETNLKNKTNIIWLETPKGKKVAGQSIKAPRGVMPQFEFVLPVDVKSGETLSILLGGSDKKKAETLGNMAQKTVQRRRPFQLFIDPKGKGEYKEPEIFTVDVKGNRLDKIRIICPSIIGKNQRFDVIVRFEDAYDNLTSLAPEGTLIELTYEQLRENLNWKLFIPETGFINLPNLYFNEEGIYRLQLKNLQTKDVFYSAPIKCFSELNKSIYWGTFHGESERYNATDQIETCLRHFRDDKDMHFYGSSSFESDAETPNETWKMIANQVADFNEGERFVTFLGFQWNGTAGSEGLRQILYLKDNKPIMRKKDSKSNALKKIYKTYTPKDILSIPCFSMGKSLHTDFTQFSPEHERVVEIYNAWGSSECSAKEGNPRPITISGKKGIKDTTEGSIRNALNRNCRFGFVAGGLDDRGVYNALFEGDQKQYSPGLSAVIATEQSREAVATALQKRSCYATTGPRILLGLEIAGLPMGSEISSKVKPGLLYNRHITGYVAGTDKIKEILIIRNGKPFKTFHPKEEDYFEFFFDDTDPLEKSVLESSDESPSFTYYYLRMEQKDGHLAWSSPIWVDLVTSAPNENQNATKSKKA